MGIINYLKEHYYDTLEAENEQLKAQIEISVNEINHLEEELMNKELRLNNRIIEKDKEIDILESTVKQLSLERDMLLKYYKIDEEPTEEQIREMRMNERIFKLELENVALKMCKWR